MYFKALCIYLDFKASARQPLSDAASPSGHVAERVASRDTGNKNSKHAKEFSSTTERVTGSAASSLVTSRLTVLHVTFAHLITAAAAAVFNSQYYNYVYYYYFYPREVKRLSRALSV